MIDLIPMIGKIAPACIKKFLSYLRNRPYVHVTAELGTRPGIHAVAIHRNRMRQSPILNTDEPAIKIRCVNETTHKCFLDRIEINFENNIMGPLSRPRSKILRVAVSRIILSSEASKVKLVGNLVA